MVSAPFGGKPRHGLWPAMGRHHRQVFFEHFSPSGHPRHQLLPLGHLEKRGETCGHLGVIPCAGWRDWQCADSLFYGLLFDRGLVYHAEAGRWLAYSGVAEWGSGYAPVLIGNVVDMFYFPLWKGTLPEWIPFKGGDYFIFFRPVFNFADSCVSIGILWLFFASRHPYGWMSQPNDP